MTVSHRVAREGGLAAEIGNIDGARGRGLGHRRARARWGQPGPFERPGQRGLGVQHRGQPRLVPGVGAAVGEHGAEQPAISHAGEAGAWAA
jgi:hypothetical protein